jgi:hypothetical protein
MAFAMLREFATYLRIHHLDALARENRRLLGAFDAPLMRTLAGRSDDELRRDLIEDLACFEREDALERAHARLQCWATDGVEVRDLVLLVTTQKEAMLAFLDGYTSDPKELLGIVRELEAHFRKLLETTRWRKQDEQRHMFELLVRSVGDYGIYLLDPRGNVASWNEGAQRLKGYTRDEIVGRPFATFFLPEDVAAGKPKDLLARAVAEGHVEDEGWRVRKDGSTFWVDAVLTPLYDQGQLVGFAKVTRDLTERRQAEEALRESNEELQAANEELTAQSEELQAVNEELTAQAEEMQSQQEELASQAGELARQREFLQDLVSNVPVALASLDHELCFRWVNPAWVAATGKPANEVVGRGVAEVFPTAHEMLERLEAVARTRELSRYAAIPLAPGREGYWDVTYVPIAAGRGGVDGLVVVAQDVTPRVEREHVQRERIDNMERMDKLKDQFLGILSHELRTPINAIMGFGSILEDGLAGPVNPQQHAYLAKMLAGADTLLALVNDLLDMSRIQAGKFQLDPRPMVFREVAYEVIASLAPLATRKRIALVDELPESLPQLVADEQRVMQVLTNLIGNAIKFTAEGGTIAVRARLEGQHLRCEIQDTGIGIPADARARLFQPFSQLDTSNTRTAGGTGLGLSIVKALVEAHGGSVGVESTPGDGSTFWFTLPVG